MSRQRKSRTGQETPRLQMTPMIDVVFQLLIFFVVTIKPLDLFSHLDVSRPQPRHDPDPWPTPDLIRILVSHVQSGFSLNGREMTLPQLESTLRQLTHYDPGSPVTIHCTDKSTHQKLVQVLDLCSKLGLQNLSIFSMDRAARP